MGAVARDDRAARVLAVVARAAVDTADSRQRTWDAFAALWGAPGGPQPAPELEARLDALAAEIASGKSTGKKAMGKLKGVWKDLGIQTSWSAQVYQVPVGELPEIPKVRIAEHLHYLAIGDASEVGGGGVRRTVLVVILADRAR